MTRVTDSKKMESDRFVDHPLFHDAKARQTILEGDPSELTRLGLSASEDRAEEYLLFLRMNCLRFLASERRQRASGGKGAESHERAAKAMENSALDVRNQLTIKNLGLVGSSLKSLGVDRELREDLYSEGILVLIRSIDRFDVRLGYRFSTYAVTAVRREMLKKLYRVTKRSSKSQSLSELDPIDTDLEPVQTPENLLQKTQEFLALLPDRDREIVKMRFGIGSNGKKMSFNKMSSHFGVSSERLRQLVQRSCQIGRKVFDFEFQESK